MNSDDHHLEKKATFLSLFEIHSQLTIGRRRVLGNCNAEVADDIEDKRRTPAKGKRERENIWHFYFINESIKSETENNDNNDKKN